MTHRPNIPRSLRTRGYALLEMLGYIALFAVLVNLSMSFFIRAGRLSERSHLVLDRMDRVRDIETAFREITDGARGIAAAAGSLHSDEHRLVLRDEDDVYRVMGELSKPGMLSVATVRLKGDETEILKLTTLSQPLKSWRFDYGADRACVTLTAEIDTAGTVNSLPSVNTFTAATGSAR
ncbi:MAG: hypothetical protein AAB353_04430 [Candidatus Hydrogenedentota bacterium]